MNLPSTTAMQALLAAALLSFSLPLLAQNAGDQKPAEASKPIPPVQPQPTAVPGRPDIPNAEVEKTIRNTPPLPFPVAVMLRVPLVVVMLPVANVVPVTVTPLTPDSTPVVRLVPFTVR